MIAALLPLLLRDLTSFLPPFHHYFTSTTSDASPPSSLSEKDEETTIEQVICPILDLLIVLTRAKKLGAAWVGVGKKKKGDSVDVGEERETRELEVVVEAVLGFTTMTTEDVSSLLWVHA